MATTFCELDVYTRQLKELKTFELVDNAYPSIVLRALLLSCHRLYSQRCESPTATTATIYY